MMTAETARPYLLAASSTAAATATIPQGHGPTLYMRGQWSKAGVGNSRDDKDPSSPIIHPNISCSQTSTSHLTRSAFQPFGQVITLLRTDATPSLTFVLQVAGQTWHH